MTMIIAMMINLLNGTMAIKTKGSKNLNKKEVIPVTWHPSRWWDCCMSEDEKKETEKQWE